jgi:hypothetical protein
VSILNFAKKGESMASPKSKAQPVGKNMRSLEQLTEDLNAKWAQLDKLDSDEKAAFKTFNEADNASNLAMLKFAEANRTYQAAKRVAQEQRIALGHLLVEAKSQCERGAWGKWLKEHFLSRSDRAAQEYMALVKTPNAVAADNARKTTNRERAAKSRAAKSRAATKPHDTQPVMRISIAETDRPDTGIATSPRENSPPPPNLDDSKPSNSSITPPIDYASSAPPPVDDLQVFTAQNAIVAMSSKQFVEFLDWLGEHIDVARDVDVLPWAQKRLRPTAEPKPEPQNPISSADDRQVKATGSMLRSLSVEARLTAFNNLGRDERELCKKALADGVTPNGDIPWFKAFNTMTAADQDTMKAIVLETGTVQSAA